eukprot:TRINITY_DN32421_c0_g1_i2.p1 TRINITY_DN32421_c0_g1~~TRINITY_DN32421_c0_g1_i2.p1  ORF type:complete len:594 (-),score=120.15 TRINITY_DN32421_c0_g1_i2:76-1857(-)
MSPGAMMQMLRFVLVPGLFATAIKVTQKSGPCPDGRQNFYPTDMPTSYTINDQKATATLDSVWDTDKLRKGMEGVQEWAIGEYWMLKMKVSSDSREDREFAFAGGSQGNFLKFTVPAGATDKVVYVEGMVQANSSDLEFEYVSKKLWTWGRVTMTDICLAPQYCDTYTCPGHLVHKGAAAQGQSERSCCEQAYCKQLDVKCTPATMYTEHVNYSTKAGKDALSCCSPIYCPADLCVNDTKWTPKPDSGILGSTPSECCEKRYCAKYECTSKLVKKLPHRHDNGSLRQGSTDAECCEGIFCSAYDCVDAWGIQRQHLPNGATTLGLDFATCCDPGPGTPGRCDNNVTLQCENNTKWGGFADGGNGSKTVGHSVEACCMKKLCSDHKCSSEKHQLLVNAKLRQGSTDEECCEFRYCKDYTCSDSTKWVPRADQYAVTNLDRIGWSDEECCEKKLCLPETCSPRTQWKAKDGAATIQGGSREECCDPVFCGDFICDTDVNGTGRGTAWYKKMDTNLYKYQGQTNEECCHPIFCSQYTTKQATRWKRKSDLSLQGSTDAECYDPVFCSDHCCPKDMVTVDDANTTQGSTDEECCLKV